MNLKKERKYEFRKRMRQIHRKDIRDMSVIKEQDDFEIQDGLVICLPKNYDTVIYKAARDFEDYLFYSMNVQAQTGCTAKNNNAVLMELDEAAEYDYKISFSENIHIKGKSFRALAQALYCLEDKMNVRKAPYIKREDIKHTFMFSPRMVHSGYEMDVFPDEHLSAIAHAGMDAILIFVKDVNFTTAGFLDFNELIDRAAAYGIDVYAYSYLESKMHPDDNGAEEFYDNLYGRLFRECPGFKGVILVGESVGFPSKDNRVAPENASTSINGIPYGKPKSGFFPCNDFPKWLNMVKKSINKYKKDADIVFWTYNWGYVNEKERIELISEIPEDVSLMATFEMFESYKMGKITQTCADYTLAFAGPGNYFESEARVAKKRGIKLYTMANTGGLTWDIGTIPYEPFPYQWIKRHENMRTAYEKYGLCGVMESHHYGFYPSFIGDLAKQDFILENDRCEDNLINVLKVRYGNKYEDVCRALKKWSEAIKWYTPTDADQYGAFRVGPAYPLCLIKDVKPPSEKFAHFGNEIMEVGYPADYSPVSKIPYGRGMLPSLRVKEEISFLEKMYTYINEGNEILSEIKDADTELLYLINLGKYIACCIRSGIHAKRWYMTVSKLRSEFEIENVAPLLKSADEILCAERENAISAIEYVDADSRLGYEPSMDYIAHRENIEWKIKHLDYVRNYELKSYEKASREEWIG